MARIRSVKPEFWQNEDLAGTTEHARLLALALLNHADDEGYFSAHVAVVRAACFPFEEDTSKILRSMDELAKIGYVEVRNAAGKAIGRVVKFRDHQAINKPKGSRLRLQFEGSDTAQSQVTDKPTTEPVAVRDLSGSDPGAVRDRSGSDPVAIPEHSRGEWNGREQGMEGKGESAPADAETLKDLDPVAPKKTPTRASFTPPTLDEVKAECRKRGNSVDPEAFWAHYDSNGWRQGNGLPLKNWRSAIVTWEKNGDRFASPKTSVQPKQLKPIGDGRLSPPKPLTPIGDGRRVG